MQLDKPNYIFYFSTDGAGTHIIRSQIIGLAEKNIKVKVVHRSFWSLATSAVLNPEEKNNLDVFKEFCKSNNINESKFPLDSLNNEKIFTIFENIFYNTNVTLDFTKDFTTENIENSWSQTDIENVQNLILEYAKRKNNKINVKFISQVRNPLDHISSLYERFNKQNSMFEFRNNVLSNLKNIEIFKKKIIKNNLQQIYLGIKLDDFIFEKNQTISKLSKLLDAKFDNNFYITKLSINKWYNSIAVYHFLNDEELLNAASIYGYKYTNLPKFLWFIRYLYGIFVRNYYETKLLFDTMLGRVNELNSINTKHKNISMLPRMVRGFLKIITGDPLKKHKEKYEKKIKLHN